MRISFHNWLNCRACAAMLLFGGTMGGLRADSIIFTPPSVPLEVPPKVEDALPKSHSDELNFTAPSGPIIPQRQQMLQRQQPREYDPDDEESKHPLLRDWTKMPDPLSRLTPKSATEKWLDKIDAKKKEQKPEDSLSPLTKFNWREDNRKEGLGRNDSTDRRLNQRKDREDERESNPFRSRKDQDKERERNAFQANGLSAPQPMDPREKAMLADIERRATAFDQLLNPHQETVTPSGKQRGSLEPVTGFDAFKAPLPTAMEPPPTRQQVVRGPIDPTKSFEERQQRKLQGSGSTAMDDLNAKYGSQSKSASSKSATQPAFSTPLLRQPLTRDIPSRSW